MRSGFFGEDEFRLLLHHLPSEIKPMVIFAYHTGWRVRNEVMPLQWRQVNLHSGIVRLEPETTKNDEERQFPFGQLEELDAVRWQQRERTNQIRARTSTLVPWVCHRDGEPIKDFTKVWRKACKAAGVLGRIPHDFRRTAVRNLERAGVSRSAAMKLTGQNGECLSSLCDCVGSRSVGRSAQTREVQDKFGQSTGKANGVGGWNGRGKTA